jgi:hypothetical protein
VFENLLPEPYNGYVLSLLYVFAEWHAYAKLRLHTETTISYLKTSPTRLGSQMRHFDRVTREAFPGTKDLPGEVAARTRRRQARAMKDPTSGNSETKVKSRYLNLKTFKWHAMGYVTKAIRMFGTTENYSTQWVCICETF